MGCSPSSPANKEDAGAKTSHSILNTAAATNNKMHHHQQQHHQHQQHQQQLSSDGGKPTIMPMDGNLIRLGPMSIYRPHQLNLLAAFPREDSVVGGLRSAVERLGWNFSLVKSTADLTLHVDPNNHHHHSQSNTHTTTTTITTNTTGSCNPPQTQMSTNNTTSSSSSCPPTIDLLLLDYRQPKLFSPETLTIIKHLKDEKVIMVAVAVVKKNFFEKNESGAEFLLDSGIDKVEIDHGLSSPVFWLNELFQLERSLVNAAYRLSTSASLLAALDHCRDMIQITDAHHRVQFVNKSYEKVLGYSCSEISGWNFLELQLKQQQLHSQGEQQQQQHMQQSHGPLSSRQQIPVDTATSPPSPIPPMTMTTSATTMGTTMTSMMMMNTGMPGPNSTIPTSQPQLLSPSAAPPFHDHVLEEVSQGKEWEGNYMYNRKTGDPIFLNCRVVPFNYKQPPFSSSSSSSEHSSEHPIAKGKSATHYIYVSDVPSAYGEKSFSSDVGSEYPMPRGSLKSLRKASYDIKSISNDSSILRRQSLAKLHSLTIEAPITKVINIIAAAQTNCPLYIANALEKVLEILRTTELYSPQFFDGNKVRSDDPLTTDLLGALLSQGPKPVSGSGRRSSNENNASRLAPRPSLPDIAEAPTNLQRLLETETKWDFDILLLEEITEKRPLVWLGMTICARFGVAQTLNTDETTLRNWLTLIEANYHSSNTYHNSTHAADVLQATAYFISTERLKTFLEPLDEAVSLIAAVVHDVDHPGKTSAFLTNSGNELALLYNDLAVLESHHAALGFKLTLSDPRVNIFKNLDAETYKTVRKSVIDMVLATEMPKHFEHLAKFVNVFTKPFVKDDANASSAPPLPADPSPDPEPDITTLITADNIVLIKRMLIKCADVANPARPLKLCIDWAKRIAEEYFRQTEEEISRGLPPVMPMFERATCSIPKSQTGFVDYFVADMYEAWDAFLDVPEVIEYMKYNYEYWKDLDKKGIRSAIHLDAHMGMGTSPPSENSYL